MNRDNPLILAITAASGIIYGLRVLEFLLKNNFKTELIISSKAYYIAKHETGINLCHCKEQIHKNILNFLNFEKGDNLKNRMSCKDENEEFPSLQLPLRVWLDDEIWANPSSGSYKTGGMIIAPASMATVAAIANGHAENLITRAADVCIKEKRPLTIVPRETPLSTIHLENMLKLSKIGVNIVLPVPGFYGKIKTLDESINFVAGKILDANNIKNDLYERWTL